MRRFDTIDVERIEDLKQLVSGGTIQANRMVWDGVEIVAEDDRIVAKVAGAD